MTSMPAAPILEVRRVLPASPDEVFRAWTDPSLLSRWMSPVGHAEAEVDVRVGGSLRIVMVGEGRRIEHTGEYLEIDPPTRLAFTWRSEYTGAEPTIVRVSLAPSGEGTEFLLTHEGLTEEAAASHGGGWGQILDRLAHEVGEAR
jgi:uncharacterized protein YndB with AHSA1/START domain